jgi:hypothetical protein
MTYCLIEAATLSRKRTHRENSSAVEESQSKKMKADFEKSDEGGLKLKDVNLLR